MVEVSGPSFFYPVALSVRGRRCLVVGGGNVGTRRASSLVEAEAVVTVVAPEATGQIREWAAEGMLTFLAELFAPEHLDGAFLAIAATENPAVNAAVRDAAREKGVLLNLAAPATEAEEEESDLGDFATMATVRRGDLLLSVTTGGAGPALSARLRRELEARFGPEWGEYVALLGKMRQAAKAHIPDAKERTAALKRLAEDEGLFARVMGGDYGAAWEEGLECLLR